MAAEFKVILTIDSQGNAKIEEVKRGLEGIGEAGAKSGQQGAAGADEFASALMRKLGVMALVTAGFWKLEQAAVGAFKAGIQAVDDFKLTTIGVAATLTDLGEKGADSQKDYARNLAYSKDMYTALELEAAKHFASGKDMTQAWNILSQKGIVLRKEEIGHLGTIVDKVKLATQGQVQGIQIAQELRAIFSGQARATDQVAMILKDKLGPEWEKVVQSVRETGSLKPLAEQFEGLVYAGEDVLKTLKAQGSTLETLLTQVGRGGLEGAYTDIAGWVSQINDYLRDHGKEISGVISTGWREVSFFIKESLKSVKEIASIVSKPIVWLIKVNFQGLEAFNEIFRRQRAPSGPGSTGEGGVMGGFVGGGGSGWGGDGGPEGDTTPAKTKKPAGGGKGGGGKGRDTSETLENLILQLRQEEAKLAEGAFSGIDAWYAKITKKIKNLAMDDKALKDGMLAASELKSAKEEKITETTNKKYLQATHQTTRAQEDDDLRLIAQMAGHPKELQQAWDIFSSHRRDQSDKLALAENQQQKTYYDSLASASILIKDQVAWKEQSWQLEKKIIQEQLEQWFKGKDINESQKDNYRGLLAMTNAAKEYNLARQKAVDLGTLEGWAIERAGEALKREKTSIKDTLTGVEGFFTDSWAKGLEGALSQTNRAWKETGKTIVQSMILELNKKSFTKIWDDIAKKLAPAAKSTLGGGIAGAGASAAGKTDKLEQQAAAGSVKAAKALQEAAKDHTEAAGGLSLSGVSLGLSAGGLLLSGIGIATNSQFLVYAGGILQLAGLAIELYQAFAATATVTEMTAAATVLEAAGMTVGVGGGDLILAASSLELAALALAAGAIFHSGGIVAHTGLLVAHGGLNLDERIVKAQVGEWIINKDTTAEYARQGVTFDMVNAGRLPVLPVPAAAIPGDGGGGLPQRFKASVPVNITVVTPDGRVQSRRQARQTITLVRQYQQHGEL